MDKAEQHPQNTIPEPETFDQIVEQKSRSDGDQDDGFHQGTDQRPLSVVRKNGNEAPKQSKFRSKKLKKNVSVNTFFGEGFSKSVEIDFDELFNNAGCYRPKLSQIGKYKESIDEGISSSVDIDSPDDDDELPKVIDGWEKRMSSATKVSHFDSVMEQTFGDMLVINFEKSQGYLGFRRRLANNINHKYCSFCPCDDTLYIFLHVLYGIICIIAGAFGVMECNIVGNINYFLLLEGVASVFLFPILIMSWTRHIGGCVHEDQTVGKGLFFLLVLILRTATVILGTILFVLYWRLLKVEKMLCHFVEKTFLIAIIFGWAFLFCAILLPFCWYSATFFAAQRLYVRYMLEATDITVVEARDNTAVEVTDITDEQAVDIGCHTISSC